MDTQSHAQAHGQRGRDGLLCCRGGHGHASVLNGHHDQQHRSCNAALQVPASHSCHHRDAESRCRLSREPYPWLVSIPGAFAWPGFVCTRRYMGARFPIILNVPCVLGIQVETDEDLTPSNILDRLVGFVRASGLADLEEGDDEGDQVVMVMGQDKPMIDSDQVWKSRCL